MIYLVTVKNFIYEFWLFLQISAPYLLLGFLISGFIEGFINTKFLAKKLSSSSRFDFLWASLLGVPLPLCSCSVVPTAATLKKSGASNAATSSFLISTPESGIDSIIFTYGILDLPMTILRPIIAFITAMVAGGLNKKFNQFEPALDQSKNTSCCSHKKKETVKENRALKALEFGFVQLIDDMVKWLVVGLILGTLVTILIPDNFFTQFTPHSSRLMILLIGIPTYICASASTPVAASLILKGLSPGCALIFLLVGPATNISNIAIIQKYIGKKGVMINIVTIALVSLIASYIVDYAYSQFFELNIKLQPHQHSEHLGLIEQGSAILLSLLMIASLIRVYSPKSKHKHSH